MPNRDRFTPAELRDKLIIDEDSLDRELVEQASYFEQAGALAVEAEDLRERAKLELEELIAEIDEPTRKRLADEETKFTETSLKNIIITLPRVKAANRKYLDAKKKAGTFDVLKKSYEQRKDMLKSIVQMESSRLNNLGVERGVGIARRNLGDRAQEQERRERREDIASRRNTTRYQPGNRGNNNDG